MKKYKYLIILLGFIAFFNYSCNRNVTPSVVSPGVGKEYDAASFNYLYVEAIKQKLMGNSGDALKYLDKCIEINPASDASYYQMAQILMAKGDLSNGKRYLSEAIELDKTNLWYLMMMGGIYYQEKNIDSALIYYEQAVKYFPERENLLLMLGNLYSESGKYDKANDIFSAFDKKFGINETSTASEIKNLMGAKKYAEALLKAQQLVKQYPDEIAFNGLLAEIYRATGDTDKAIEVYNGLMERNPDDGQTQLSICNFLIGEKSYDELFVMLNTVFINDNISREDKISLAAGMIENPEITGIDNNKFLIALMVLEAGYEGDDIVPLLRPELFMKQNKLDEAAMRLEELIKQMPDNYYAWEKLLFVYLQQKDYEKLTLRGEECATRFNRSYVAKLLYANGALETGKYSVALEELRKAEILAGDNKDFLNQVLTMRADVYYKMKDYTKAFDIFDEAVKANSNDMTVLNNYAYYLAEQNMKLKEAESMARKVIETEKGNNTFLDTYGWVLYKRGKLKEAAKVMEDIIGSGDKPDAEWYEHYGYILKKQKKCDKAIENWNIAMSLDSTKKHLIKEIENCKK